MSKFAIIPWSSDYACDNIINKYSPANHDQILDPYDDFAREFVRCGHEIHTIDMYEDWQFIDYFLFFTFDRDIYKRVVRLGLADKMVYCTAEPPSVYAYNTPRGYGFLKHIFPYILTWNDEWVDNKRIFKRNIPYIFVDQRNGGLDFESRKLLTCINSNRESSFPGELYSERLRAIDYFEKNAPHDFDFYGKGWENSIHQCYCGPIERKADIYHKYRFAICYENIEGYRGYITEKFMDCLVSGIVPIYAGAPNIRDYFPTDCYIDLRDYKDYHSLHERLLSIDKNEYQRYLDSAENILNSAVIDAFSGERYAHYIMDAVRKNNKVPLSALFYKLFKRVKW